jgi:hypothetical protein
MRICSTAGVFGAMLAAYGLILSPSLFVDGYLDSPVGVLVLMPYLSVYLFHAAGVPGLLVNGGACGWGWCAPTVFGWVFLAGVWVGLAWGLAHLLARLCAARRRSEVSTD